MAFACTATPATPAPTPTSTQAPRIPIGESNSWKLIAETAKKILDESLAGQHINKRVDYAKAGNYEMAAQEFTKAIELDPDYAAAYYNRGLAYGMLGQRQNADADFAKACFLDGKYC